MRREKATSLVEPWRAVTELMGEQEREEEEGGPGRLYRPFLRMESLLERLQLLDCHQLLAQLGMRNLTRHYFVLQVGTGLT